MKAKHLFVIAVVFLESACARLFGSSKREGVSSSLVDYLDPDGEKPPGQAVERIRTDGSVTVTHASRYTGGGGGGAIDAAFLLLLGALAPFTVARKRRGA